MFRSGSKVSLYVLILAVLAVGIGAFFAGYFFAGWNSRGDYVALSVYEMPVQEEDEADEPDTDGKMAEPNEEPTAIAIYVFNPFSLRYEREAMMRSMEDVEATKYLLTLRFLTENTIEYSLYPEWRLVSVDIGNENNFQSPSEAFERLDRRIRDYVEHEIEPGDTLEKIAHAWDMDLHELMRINNITEEYQLEPGQRLWVIWMSPLINVITVEEAWDIVPLTRHVEVFYVDTLPQAHLRVVREGRDGDQVIITRIYRRGTVIIDKIEFPGDIITPAVAQIIEVGR